MEPVKGTHHFVPVGTRYDHETEVPEKVTEGEKRFVTLSDEEGVQLLGNIKSCYKQSQVNRLGMEATGELEPSEHLYIGLGDDQSSTKSEEGSSEVTRRRGPGIHEDLDDYFESIIRQNEELLAKIDETLGIDPLLPRAKSALTDPTDQLIFSALDEILSDTDEGVTVCDEIENDDGGDSLLPTKPGRPLMGKEVTDEGKEITDEYGDLGTEQIDRIDTLDLYESLLDQETGRLDPHRAQRARVAKQNLSILDKSEKWVKSQDFRALCREYGYRRACELFPRGAPVNLRIQTMTNKLATGDYEAEKKLGQLARLGAITDVTNGWYTFEELEQMLVSPSLIEEKIKEINETVNNPKPSSLIGKIKKHVFRIKPEPTENQRESARLAISALEEGLKTSGASLKALMQEREEVLEQQMMQYLMEQIRANPENVMDGQPFSLIQLSLLNLRKRSLDSSGWMHDESVSFRDFRYIMKKFNGKKIIFADEGPFLAGDYIFLPKKLMRFPPDDPIELNTYMFNLSVQGNTKNKGLQFDHNMEELTRLLQDHNKDIRRDIYKDVREKLVREDSQSNYRLAEDFGVVLHDVAKYKGAFGINCQSGKDRTGVIGTRIMMRKLKRVHGRIPRENRIFEKKSAAMKVARDNVPKAKVLKVDPRNALKDGLPGIKKPVFALEVLPKMILSKTPV